MHLQAGSKRMQAPFRKIICLLTCCRDVPYFDINLEWLLLPLKLQTVLREECQLTPCGNPSQSSLGELAWYTVSSARSSPWRILGTAIDDA